VTQLERLIARLVQLVEDSPGQMIVITITVDSVGVPVCWQVKQGQVEGLTQDNKGVVK
jgi:hypothetical protein